MFTVFLSAITQRAVRSNLIFIEFMTFDCSILIPSNNFTLIMAFDTDTVSYPAASHTICAFLISILSILRYFKVLLVYASSFSLFSQYWFTALHTVFFHVNFPGGFSKRSWDDGKSYCSIISDTSINQPCDSLNLTANWRWANSHSTVPKFLSMFNLQRENTKECMKSKICATQFQNLK